MLHATILYTDATGEARYGAYPPPRAETLLELESKTRTTLASLQRAGVRDLTLAVMDDLTATCPLLWRFRSAPETRGDFAAHTVPPSALAQKPGSSVNHAEVTAR